MRHSTPSHFHRPDKINDKLYVITPLYNQIRWRSRWKHLLNFQKHIIDSGAHLITIECAFGERDYVITEPIHENHTIIHVRTEHELWIKENLINIAISRLPEDWKYVAWIDADVLFSRPDWVGETLHQLQHYKIVQMWSQYQDLTYDYEIVGTMRSFMDCYLYGGGANLSGNSCKGDYSIEKKRVGYPGAPGLAWAMRRDAWNELGGLIDISILGACDWYMAHALIGDLKVVLSTKYNERYREQLFEWERRAEKYIKRNVGVIKGVAQHFWHGPKVHRKYGSREQILIKHNYNPDIDLKKDWQGLYQLTDRNIQLRDDIKLYFRQRNEDSI